MQRAGVVTVFYLVINSIYKILYFKTQVSVPEVISNTDKQVEKSSAAEIF